MLSLQLICIHSYKHIYLSPQWLKSKFWSVRSLWIIKKPLRGLWSGRDSARITRGRDGIVKGKRCSLLSSFSFHLKNNELVMNSRATRKRGGFTKKISSQKIYISFMQNGTYTHLKDPHSNFIHVEGNNKFRPRPRLIFRWKKPSHFAYIHIKIRLGVCAGAGSLARILLNYTRAMQKLTFDDGEMVGAWCAGKCLGARQPERALKHYRATTAWLMPMMNEGCTFACMENVHAVMCFAF